MFNVSMTPGTFQGLNSGAQRQARLAGWTRIPISRTVLLMLQCMQPDQQLLQSGNLSKVNTVLPLSVLRDITPSSIVLWDFA
jgi:hypothetical protein